MFGSNFLEKIRSKIEILPKQQKTVNQWLISLRKKTHLFEISQFGCGIEINALDFDMHDGDWKCHIADTDKNSSHVKVEAETTLNVAQKSSKF